MYSTAAPKMGTGLLEKEESADEKKDKRQPI